MKGLFWFFLHFSMYDYFFISLIFIFILFYFFWKDCFLLISKFKNYLKIYSTYNLIIGLKWILLFKILLIFLNIDLKTFWNRLFLKYSLWIFRLIINIKCLIIHALICKISTFLFLDTFLFYHFWIIFVFN